MIKNSEELDRQLEQKTQMDKNTEVIKERKVARGRPKVSLDRIVEAAMEIIDTQGIDALSMRTIAQQLGSGTATLYRHFNGRADIISLVVDRIIADVVIEFTDAELGDRQSSLAAMARSMYRFLSRYKGIATLLTETMPNGPNSMVLRERLISFLLKNGFKPEIAARAFATIFTFVLGFAIQGDSQENSGSNEKSNIYLSGVDPDKYPSLNMVAKYLPIPLDVEFEFGLQLILSGLSQLQE